MSNYIEGSFIIDMSSLPEGEELEKLKSLFMRCGYKKTQVPLICSKIVPLVPLEEPACLKFYERYNTGDSSNGKTLA